MAVLVDSKVEALEDEFVTQFSNWLWTLSNVSADFCTGGNTTAELSTSKNILIKGVPAAAAFLIPMSYGKPIVKPAEELILKLFNILERKDKLKIYRILPQKEKIGLKIYVEAALKIFRAFECQFSNVVAVGDENGIRAMAKLAEDAGERVINYILEDSSEIESPIGSADFIFNAVLFGQSKGIFNLFKGRTLQFDDGHKTTEWTTTKLFETSGYVFNKNNKQYFYELKKGSRAREYGYRQLWPFDEFYQKRNWDEEEPSPNFFTEYKYKLTFTEEAVQSKVDEFIKKKVNDKQATRKDVQEILRNELPSISDYLTAGGIPLGDPLGSEIKWWETKKENVNGLYKRKAKSGDKLLVEDIHGILENDKKKTVVIRECESALKLSAMGGIGKTTTATWYANHYEDEYDHILWINCGQGRLVATFKKLARKINVKNRDELLNEEFARESYQVLFKYKCLLVFDNVENYEEIKKFLPSSEFKNFNCLITSRCDKWGVENGFPISVYQLENFSAEESLAFLKENLTIDKSLYTEDKLKSLGELVGHLPLALQLAVSALNNKNINLQDYIKSTNTNLENIVNQKFDDYEKTICGCVETSLKYIARHKNGKVAQELLTIFGYIRPHDVQSLFLMEAAKLKLANLADAVEILYEYKLISKTGTVIEFPYKNGFYNKLFGWDKTEVEMNTLSVHPLLQQVIRHNGRNRERKTLSKILACKGFMDYKLFPFSKYADDELRQQFPKVKANLVDQERLVMLMKEKRYGDCVEVSRLLHDELKTLTSKFNYAICLEKNEHFEQCLTTLEELRNENLHYIRCNSCVEMGMLQLDEEVSKNLLYGHMLIINWRIGKLENKNKVKEMLETSNEFQIINSTESLSALIQVVTSDLITSKYSLIKEEKDSFINLKLDVEQKKIDLAGCSIEVNYFDRISPQILSIWKSSFFENGQELETVRINDLVDLRTITRMSLSGGTKINMSLDMSDKDISMEYAHLEHVKVDWKKSNWSIRELRLWSVPLLEKSEMKVLEMEILSPLDISCLPKTVECLVLSWDAEVSCSGEVDLPKLNHLGLNVMSNSSSLSLFHSVPFTQVHFIGVKDINLKLLPKSVTEMKISKHHDPRTETVIVGELEKEMDNLILNGFSLSKSEQYLNHIKTNKLVVYYSSISSSDLKNLITKDIKTIAVGEVDWDEADFESLSLNIDKRAVYYLWEGGRGTALSEEEFEKLRRL